MLDPNIGTDECELRSLVGDGGFMCGGLEPPLAEGASQISQGASLLEPPAQRHLDVTVDIPVKEVEVNTSPFHTAPLMRAYTSCERHRGVTGGSNSVNGLTGVAD